MSERVWVVECLICGEKWELDNRRKNTRCPRYGEEGHTAPSQNIPGGPLMGNEVAVYLQDLDEFEAEMEAE